MSWGAMILISIGVIALLVFLVSRNIKDEKKIEKQAFDEEFISEKHKTRSEDEIN